MSGFRPRFFAPSNSVELTLGTGSVLTLDAEDSHHALRVLRLRPGDECELVMGAAVYAATVLGAAPGGESGVVQVQLGEQLEGAALGGSYRFPVALVQAFARPAALDWSIEKSTEAGVSLILLVQAAGSPRSSAKEPAGRAARWARIAREAAKQSKQPAVPAVEPCDSFATALAHLDALALPSVLLEPAAEQSLYDVVRSYAGVALWVGPESGWTGEEREGLLRSAMACARLGRGVLRTETAGPVAVAVARLALGDW